MRALTALARRYDAHVVWDLSPLGRRRADRPARGRRRARCRLHLQVPQLRPWRDRRYLYVAEELQGGLRSPIQGWFGQRDQFAMERPYEPVDGIGRFLAGTPPILGLAAVEAGVALTAEAGIDAIRSKSVALTALMIALRDEWLAPLGFELGTPRDAARAGRTSRCATTTPGGSAAR